MKNEIRLLSCVLMVIVMAFSALSCGNSDAEEASQQLTKDDVTFDDLQNCFTEITAETTEDSLSQLIEKNGFFNSREEYNGGTIKYKIAVEKDVTPQKHAESGSYIEVSFDKEGLLEVAEYFNLEHCATAFYYNHGVYWTFSGDDPSDYEENYEGYYYSIPGNNKGGITVKYSNGNEAETGYFPAEDASDAILKVLSVKTE